MGGRTGREGRREICNTLHHGIKTHNNCNLIYTYVTYTPHGHHGNKVPSHTRKPSSPSLVHHSQYAERRGNVLVVMAAVCLQLPYDLFAECCGHLVASLRRAAPDNTHWMTAQVNGTIKVEYNSGRD